MNKTRKYYNQLIKFLKPSKDKKKLFYFMILIAFLTSVIDMFLTRFMVEHYYHYYDGMVYQFYYRVVDFLRYFLIAYLSVAYIKKTYSIRKELYNIFKVILLLFAINVLHNALIVFVVNSISEDVYMLTWVQWSLASTSLITYYIVACYVYSLKKRRLI